jgi:hypothetical protein
MMTLANVKDWLKTVVTEDAGFYIGKIDGDKEKCIGVYGMKLGQPVIAIGGMSNTTYAYKPVSILIHWTTNASTTELIAQALYENMIGQSDISIGGHRVICFDMQTPEPVPVGTDNHNIFEYVIETNIIYER